MAMGIEEICHPGAMAMGIELTKIGIKNWWYMGNHVGIIGIPQKIALQQGAKSGILFSDKPSDGWCMVKKSGFHE